MTTPQAYANECSRWLAAGIPLEVLAQTVPALTEAMRMNAVTVPRTKPSEGKWVAQRNYWPSRRRRMGVWASTEADSLRGPSGHPWHEPGFVGRPAKAQ